MYPHFIFNNAILKKIGPHTIPKKFFEYTFYFRAKNSEANLLLESYNSSNRYIRIFGIKVELLSTDGQKLLLPSEKRAE